MSNISYDVDQETYYFNCPHCDLLVAVPKIDIRCTRFCHGNLKSNNKHISPYTTKGESKLLLEKGLIYGCGKPFTFDGNSVVGRDAYWK